MSNGPIVVNLPSPYKKQREAIWAKERFTFIEGSTKSGKTAGCLMWQAEQVLTGPPDSLHWWVAPSFTQAKIAYGRAKRDFEGLYVKALGSPEFKLEFKGGRYWQFRSGENYDSLYGEEVTSAVIDEASRMREDAWTAVRSTVTSTRGPIRVIGNVAGKGNWFYRLSRRAEAGEPNYAFHKLTAQDAVDAGVMEQAELDQAKRDLPEPVFLELYFCIAADDALNPFGNEALTDAFVEDLVAGPPVVFGIDLARKQDYTVIIGIDTAGNVAFFDRFQLPWNEAYERIQRSVGRRPVLVDATGIGDPISNELRMRGMAVTPYLFSANSKQDLMEGLRIGFSDRAIKHNIPILRAELDVFEYSHSQSGRVTYSAPSGGTDDAVMALSLAWLHGVSKGLIRRDGIAGSGMRARRGIRRQDRAKFYD